MGSLVITFDESKAHQLRVHMTQDHLNVKAKTTTTIAKEKRVSIFQRLSERTNVSKAP